MDPPRIQILAHHHIDKISIVAHSWGTFIAGWILQLNPSIISHVTFIDPVSITFLYPETTYTIVYKKSQSIEDHLLDYFVRHDISVSNTIHRHFTWYNEALSLDSIPASVGVVLGLSCHDALVNFRVALDLVELCNAGGKRNNKRHQCHTRMDACNGGK
jgi:pimeloyl-ACP methyl ester carboxylesterase